MTPEAGWAGGPRNTHDIPEGAPVKPGFGLAGEVSRIGRMARVTGVMA